MSYELDVKKVISNLRAAEEVSGCFPEDVFSVSSSGMKYLCDNVLVPMMKGKTVDSSDLDFTQFERQDLYNLWNTYLDTLSYNSHYRKTLEGIYKILKSAVPNACTVGFV